MLSFSVPPGFFRVFLALAVCVSHLSRLNIGGTAVFVFFMLSGYWTIRMYQEKYSRLPNPRTTFWIARFLRIWILYITCLTLAMLVFWLCLDRYDPAFWYGLPLLGVATHHNDILGVSWSLDLEVQFYLLIPLVAGILAGTAVKAHRIAVLALAAVVTVVGWIIIGQFGLVTVLAYVLPFMAGVLIYEWDIRSGWKGAAISVAVFVGLGFVLALYPATRGFLDKTVDAPFDAQWFGLLWALLLVPFVAYNVRVKSTRFDRHLGNLSYSIYLVHFPFYVLVAALFSEPGPLEKLIMLGLTVPLALLPYLFIDQRIERKRESWSLGLANWIWSRPPVGEHRPAMVDQALSEPAKRP